LGDELHIYAANQALVTFAVNCVGTNLVTFMAVVMRLDNADAANRANNWAGTTYVFSIVGALVSDSYWGRYKACTIFQIIFLAVRTYFLNLDLNPNYIYIYIYIYICLRLNYISNIYNI
jgi:dipeptide/tripeptide permease